jgi:hypothetical protein
MGITLIKDGVMRVVVTIREDRRPDWFRALQKVSSGQARAELLRAHLTPPSEDHIFEVQPRPVKNPSPPPERTAKTNSSPASTGIPRNIDPPENDFGVRRELPEMPAPDDDESAESLAEMLVRIRPGGV